MAEWYVPEAMVVLGLIMVLISGFEPDTERTIDKLGKVGAAMTIVGIFWSVSA